MTTPLLPLFRLTVYAPKSEDPTETTVLTPIVGAAHTDQFIVTSLQGIAGAKPYLGLPQGKQGTLDYVSKKTTIGNIALPVFDPRVTAGGSNAVRWSTAFMGDTLGRPRLNGCRFTLERSLDGTATSLVPYMAGRIRNHAVKRAQWLDLDLKDYADDLARPIFLGVPNTSVSNYAASVGPIPIGLPRAFAGQTAASPLSAKVQQITGTDGIVRSYVVWTDLGFVNPERYLVTKALYESATGSIPRLVVVSTVENGATVTASAGAATFSSSMSGLLFNGSTITVGGVSYTVSAFSGTTTCTLSGAPTFSATAFAILRTFKWVNGDQGSYYFVGNGGGDHQGLKSVQIEALPAADPRYTPIPTYVSGVGVESSTASIVFDGPPTPALPILIDDVHPIKLFADIVDGKYSRTFGLETPRPLAGRDTSGGGPWDVLLTDPSFGTMRDVIDKTWKGSDYIEKAICQRFNITYRLDEQGRVVPKDLRRTSALAGVVTLTDDDLDAGVEPAWDDSRDGAVTGVQYDYLVDKRVSTRDLLGSTDQYPDIGPALFVSTPSTLFVINDLSTLRDVGEKIVKIDARSTRMMAGAGAIGGAIALDVKHKIERALTASAKEFLRPLSTGTVKATLGYRLASANLSGIASGVYAILNHTKLPNPASNQRGGARLALCLSRNDQDARASITWLDCGEGSVSVTPVVGAVSTPDGALVSVPITVNAAGDSVDVWAAVTTSGVGVRPVDSDAAWGFIDTLVASGTLTFADMAPGQRVWVRARSHAAGSALKLPSSWAYPTSGTGYVDLTNAAASAPGAEVYVPASQRGRLFNLRRQDNPTASTATISFDIGADVTEVWGAYRIVAYPDQATDWPAVASAVSPLAAGATSFTVPLPVDGQATIVQLEPRFADLTAGVVKRIVITSAAQAPTYALDDKETATLGTQYVQFTERGIAIVSIEVQTQIGVSPVSSWGPPTRVAGAPSTVKSGVVLGTLAIEHDVLLDASRQSWVFVRYTLANGSVLYLPPFGFDRDKNPNLGPVTVDSTGKLVTIIGDIDTKSVGLYAKSGTWKYEVDGTFANDIDVTKTGTNGVAGLAPATSGIFTAKALADPVVGITGGTLFDSRDITVLNGGTAPAAGWDSAFVAAPPSAGSAAVTISLKATSAPALWTVKLYIDESATSGAVSPITDRTATVSPAAGAVPTTLTSYVYTSAFPAGSGGRYVTLRARADLLDGTGAVVATKYLQANWYT